MRLVASELNTAALVYSDYFEKVRSSIFFGPEIWLLKSN